MPDPHHRVQLTSLSKGKAERMFFTIQQDFEAGLRLPGQGVSSLEELNAQFSRWLQTVYHPRIHSSTRMSPAERYQRGAHLVKARDPLWSGQAGEPASQQPTPGRRRL